MSKPPTSCVIDTNVPVTANGRNAAAGAECAASCARALHEVMKKGHLFVDSGGRIVDEYRRNLRAKGEPGPGDMFLKWVLDHEWIPERVTQVTITPTGPDDNDFLELPEPDGDLRYDLDDKKFLAVAAAHEDRPPILQSFDSKWWGWRDALRAVGVVVCFLCEAEIRAKHAEKMGG